MNPTQIELTQRDRALLDTLTRRVRLLSVEQVAAAFWGSSNRRSGAERRLRQLAEAGLLVRTTILARPLIELEAPVVLWTANDPRPDFGPVSHRLRARWQHPPRATNVVYATTAAGAWMGGQGGRAPRRSEATHDLHLAAVYLRLLREHPHRAAGWVSEGRLLAGGSDGKLPDAVIELRDERTAVEFGGAYSVRKLEAFHEHCESCGLNYEIW